MTDDEIAKHGIEGWVARRGTAPEPVPVSTKASPGASPDAGESNQ